ncbi:MAG TPA: hypothetical protein VE616_17955 [Candidatus Udaeobacter sp.]|nr:hypothetical protein [Candidatus Udaeobacter sp.]
MLDPDKLGFVLWEGLTLLTVIFGGIGLMVLRRKLSARPAFTIQDRQLFFGHSQLRLSTSRLLLKFGIAVLLSFFIGVLEVLTLARFGTGVLTVVLVLTCLTIVRKLLFQ